MFIAFEGPEGSGKSTQVRLVAERLRVVGYDVVTTREPGGTPLGEAVRNLLLDSSVAVNSVAESYLMTGARAQHVRETIRPALECGAIVLSDRFSASTLAYQGAGRGLHIHELRVLQELAVGQTVPDLFILIDIDVGIGLQRRRNHGALNRIDREDLSFHLRVAEWYRHEATEHSDAWIVVDGDREPHEVCADILAAISTRLSTQETLPTGGMAR